MNRRSFSKQRKTFRTPDQFVKGGGTVMSYQNCRSLLDYWLFLLGWHILLSPQVLFLSCPFPSAVGDVSLSTSTNTGDISCSLISPSFGLLNHFNINKSSIRQSGHILNSCFLGANILISMQFDFSSHLKHIPLLLVNT